MKNALGMHRIASRRSYIEKGSKNGYTDRRVCARARVTGTPRFFEKIYFEITAGRRAALAAHLRRDDDKDRTHDHMIRFTPSTVAATPLDSW